MTTVPKDRARPRRSDVQRGRASLLALLLAAVVLGAPDASLAQSVGATLDDNVPGGTYKLNGDTLNYRAVITNSGGASATGVQATTPTPSDTNFRRRLGARLAARQPRRPLCRGRQHQALRRCLSACG